jgi:hypothetical protein
VLAPAGAAGRQTASTGPASHHRRKDAQTKKQTDGRKVTAIKDLRILNTGGFLKHCSRDSHAELVLTSSTCGTGAAGRQTASTGPASHHRRKDAQTKKQRDGRMEGRNE